MTAARSWSCATTSPTRATWAPSAAPARPWAHRASIIPNKRSARVEASTYKSSAGAITHVPVAQVSNIVQSIHRLQEEGFWVCAATEHTDDLVWNANLKGKIAIVLGNEHDGVSRLVLEHCDMYAKLPLEGEVASLNVAQAATAVMYEWLRQNIHTA